MRACEHRDVRVLVRERTKALMDRLQRREQCIVPRLRERHAVREVVDVLGRAREMEELRDAGDLGHAGEPLLQPVLDRLHVVVRLALDRLDARGVGEAELATRGLERRTRIRAEGGHFGDRRLVGECQQPRDLDPYAAADQRVFAEVVAQRVELVRIAAIEWRQRGERGFDGQAHAA